MHRKSGLSEGMREVELRVDEANKAGSETGRLLELFAFFAPESIPADIISEKFMERQVRDEALAELDAAFLLKLSKSQGGEITITVAPGVQQVMRERLKLQKLEDSAACSALHLVADAFPLGDKPKESRHWPICEKLLPHALQILELMPDEGEGAAPTAYLLCQTGRYLNSRSKFALAEPMLRRALKITEASYGADHPAVAIHLKNLVELLKNTKRFGDAESMCRRAIAINEQSFAPITRK